jgi:hypothetical protein
MNSDPREPEPQAQRPPADHSQANTPHPAGQPNTGGPRPQADQGETAGQGSHGPNLDDLYGTPEEPGTPDTWDSTGPSMPNT